MSRNTTTLSIAAAIALLALPFGGFTSDVITAAPLAAMQDQAPIYNLTISGNTGAKRVIAVPDFSVSGAADVQQAAKTMASVLWDDIDFEGEFTMVSRAEAAKVPAATSPENLAYDRWSELGADMVVLGSVQPAASGGLSVQIQIIGTRGDLVRKSVFGKSYSGGGCNLKNPRNCAHYISDDFYKEKLGINGVARTRLAFVSDRNNEIAGGRVSDNSGSEVYISDYDGANPYRITVNRTLNVSPSWSPDGRSLSYTSYKTGFPDIYVQNIFGQTPLARPAKGTEIVQSSQPAFSPDGNRIAFASRGAGARNYNIWVVNRDGSGMRQLTTGDTGDVSPNWSPNGAQIVYASGKTGKPQLYLVSSDGGASQRLPCQESECDHPSWSAAANKIAYTCGAASSYDICVLDMGGSRQIVKVTDSVGSNEQPSFAPNGRHIVFTTTRWGKKQLAMTDLKGNVLKRRITETGNNNYPDWSHASQ